MSGVVGVAHTEPVAALRIQVHFDGYVVLQAGFVEGQAVLYGHRFIVLGVDQKSWWRLGRYLQLGRVLPQLGFGRVFTQQAGTRARVPIRLNQADNRVKQDHKIGLHRFRAAADGRGEKGAGRCCQVAARRKAQNAYPGRVYVQLRGTLPHQPQGLLGIE